MKMHCSTVFAMWAKTAGKGEKSLLYEERLPCVDLHVHVGQAAI